ncbi:hypothetical protein LQU94_03040 [Peptoniphilus sp. KCTC 25270]|uniref:hypothetical protein n=1 Tax=Peptoniphilus sp. KCTC 25270 TaxID=2897414 RepID=UPI001E29A653|nr:hypothetical protein [Peptoniphilus sp. KCTC 25270]MCD1147090.1 hypothetical protein [Peptoniphilus sp. KCTC 25270]
MINWEKAENANSLKIYLKNGEIISGSGNGLEIGEEIGEEEDLFFIWTKNNEPMSLLVKDIDFVEILD